MQVIIENQIDLGIGAGFVIRSQTKRILGPSLHVIVIPDFVSMMVNRISSKFGGKMWDWILAMHYTIRIFVNSIVGFRVRFIPGSRLSNGDGFNFGGIKKTSMNCEGSK